MLSMDELHVVAYYKARAEEMRSAAEYEHPEEAAILASIAQGFDRLAEKAQRHTQGSTIYGYLHRASESV